MKIAALIMVYDESLILPYFLRHYAYLDEIHALYETDSTDSSLAILKQAANVTIENCHIEGGLDDTDKAKLINETLHNMKADWVFVLDPDEFIFAPDEPSAEFLMRQNYNIVRAAMFQVYRHRTDADLNPDLPPLLQRVHGDPNLYTDAQDPNRDKNAEYIKPIIIRPSSKIQLLRGNHLVVGDVNMSPELFAGAHWYMADPSIALERRIKRRNRISTRNKALKLGHQNWNVTEEYIMKECASHLDDPIVDALNRVPADQPLKSFFYIEDKSLTASYLRLLTFESLMKRVQTHKTAGMMLCLGYSCHLFLRAALKSGFDAYGIDCSSSSTSALETDIQKRITYGDLSLRSNELPTQFDVVAESNILGQTQKSRPTLNRHLADFKTRRHARFNNPQYQTLAVSFHHQTLADALLQA